ncbi:MAG: copper transporter [Actinomycetota bacterium]
MIDFRYHLVSIIAVFFALAVGIVLGAGPLGERVEEDLPDQLAEMRETNQQYQEQIRMLEAQQEFRDGFIAGVAPELVSDRLANRQVALFVLPGADDDVAEEMAELLEQAGATVTASVAVDSSWTDPESEATLDTIATDLASAGTTLPSGGDGYDRGAVLLANAVVRPPLEETLSGDVPGVEDNALDEASRVNQDVLSALSEADLVEVSGDPQLKAPLALAIAGPAPEPEEGEDVEDGQDTQDGGAAGAAASQQPLTAIVAALADAADGTVAAGPTRAAAAGGLLAGVRNDEELADRVSTVDSVNLLSGRIAAVYAIAEQADGDNGQYGYLGAEDGPVPPVPEIGVPDVPPAATEGGGAPGDDGTTGDGEDSAGDGDTDGPAGDGDGAAGTDEEGGQ